MKNIIIQIVVLILCCPFAYALNLEAEGISVTNLKYDYKMLTENGRVDCVGNLSFTVSIDDNVSLGVLERSRKHLTEPPRLLQSRSILLEKGYDNPVATFTLSDWSWGTYFRFTARNDDNTWTYTPTLNINDFLDAEDLRMILESASIYSPDFSEVEIRVDNHTLLIDCGSPITVSVYTLNGHRIIHHKDVVVVEENIPQHEKMIFVEFIINGKRVVKKIML